MNTLTTLKPAEVSSEMKGIFIIERRNCYEPRHGNLDFQVYTDKKKKNCRYIGRRNFFFYFSVFFVVFFLQKRTGSGL